jgi:hypothetical protein
MILTILALVASVGVPVAVGIGTVYESPIDSAWSPWLAAPAAGIGGTLLGLFVSAWVYSQVMGDG